MAFSPDGKHIATGLNNQMIILWDVESRLEVNRFPTHHDDWQEIMSIAFSADGNRLVCAGWGRPIQQWDPKTGTELTALNGHFIGVASAIYTPDGQQIISASIDGTCRIWSSEATQSNFISEIDQDLSSLPLTDGWIKSANGGLLLWVPPDYRNGMKDMCSHQARESRTSGAMQEQVSGLYFLTDG